MYKFCFVILHYNAVEDTVECIESILSNIGYENKEIILVDNNSPNNSGEYLLDKYRDCHEVHVILNDNNIGFANGNNVGYRYAVNQLKADFVATINNDTVIYDASFVEKIISLFENENFHLMGPDIILKNGQHQNPYKEKGETLEEVNEFLKNYKKLFISSLLRAKIGPLYHIITNFKKKQRNKLNQFNYLKTYENIVLHGSAIIFSPLYTYREEFAFHPDTFMFLEEDILYYFCMSKDYKVIYSPVTSIYHKEDISTDSVLKTDYQKLKFKFQNVRKSRLVLRSILEKN